MGRKLADQADPYAGLAKIDFVPKLDRGYAPTQLITNYDYVCLLPSC